MSEFKWHMMAEKMPEKGKKDYLVMGLKGGLYLAPRFEGYGERGDDVWFRDTRGKLHYPDEVLAWAEVPKLEDRDAQESENSKLRELVDAVKEFVEDTHCEDCPCRRDCDDNNRIFCANDFSYHAFAAMRELEIGVDG